MIDHILLSFLAYLGHSISKNIFPYTYINIRTELNSKSSFFRIYACDAFLSMILDKLPLTYQRVVNSRGNHCDIMCSHLFGKSPKEHHLITLDQLQRFEPVTIHSHLTMPMWKDRNEVHFISDPQKSRAK